MCFTQAWGDQDTTANLVDVKIRNDKSLGSLGRQMLETRRGTQSGGIQVINSKSGRALGDS